MSLNRADFTETWTKLGATVEFALSVIEAGPAPIAALLAAARKGIGTEGERSLLLAMSAVKKGAEAQIEIADRVIAMVEAAAKSADETALAALSAGASH
jgi:hypothetical protein